MSEEVRSNFSLEIWGAVSEQSSLGQWAGVFIFIIIIIILIKILLNFGLLRFYPSGLESCIHTALHTVGP